MATVSLLTSWPFLQEMVLLKVKSYIICSSAQLSTTRIPISPG